MGERPSGRVLMITSCPKGHRKLNFAGELEAIKQGLESAAGLPWDFKTEVDAQDLEDLLLTEPRPVVVHFSGHGQESGAFEFTEEATKRAQVAAPSELAKVLKRHRDDLGQLGVVFNACFSAKQAEFFVDSVDWLVAMDAEIHDSVAIDFARGFYASWAAGRSVEQAFDAGLSASGKIIGQLGADVARLFVDGKLVRPAEISDTPPDDLVTLLERHPDLHRAMADELPDTPRELARRMTNEDELTTLTVRFLDAMLLLAASNPGQTRERLATGLMQLYEPRALLLARSEVGAPDEHGCYRIEFALPAAFEAPMAAVSGRPKPEFERSHSKKKYLRPRYLIETEDVPEPGIAPEGRAEVVAQDFDARTRTLEKLLDKAPKQFKGPIESDMDIDEKVEIFGVELETARGHVCKRSGKSHYYAIIRSADQPVMLAFAEILRRQLDVLRQVYTTRIRADRDERKLVTHIRDLYEAYHEIVGRKHG